MPLIRLQDLHLDRGTWIRDAVDHDRVEMFSLQMQEGEVFPSIEVVPTTNGPYLVGDGVHRVLAARRLGHTEIEAVIVIPKPNETDAQCAYRTALETASRSALPLTGAERRRAAIHLLQTQVELSRRQIAQLVGVAHSSVNRWAVEVDQSSTPDADSDLQAAVGPTADKVARRLVSVLDRLSESRGFLDLIASKRMGRHLADAFADRFGESALGEARRFRTWLDGAVASLEED